MLNAHGLSLSMNIFGILIENFIFIPLNMIQFSTINRKMITKKIESTCKFSDDG